MLVTAKHKENMNPTRSTIWAFDLGSIGVGSTGDSPVALGDPPNARFLFHKPSLLIPAEFAEIKNISPLIL